MTTEKRHRSVSLSLRCRGVIESIPVITVSNPEVGFRSGRLGSRTSNLKVVLKTPLCLQILYRHDYDNNNWGKTVLFRYKQEITINCLIRVLDRRILLFTRWSVKSSQSLGPLCIGSLSQGHRVLRRQFYNRSLCQDTSKLPGPSRRGFK